MLSLIVSALFFFLGSLTPSASAQVTPITEIPDYITARVCVQSAVGAGMYYGVDPGYLGCGQQQSQTCLCGSLGSVSEQINQYIYNQASDSCGDTIEASSATAIFNEYCAGSAADGTSDSTTTTADSASQSTTAGANPKSKATNPAATSTSASSSTGNNNGGDSTNNINIKTGGASQTSSSRTPIIASVTVGLALLTVLGLSW